MHARARRDLFDKKKTDTITDTLKGKLMNIKPKLKCRLDGLSLVVKYSDKDPNILITADEKGILYIINCLNGSINPGSINMNHNNDIPLVPILKKIQAHASPIFDIDWHNNFTNILTGSGDLSCSVIDIETSKLIYRGIEHQNSVRAVKSCKYNANLFLTGGRDGKLILWDTRKKLEKKNVIGNECLIAPKIIDIHNAEVNSFTGVGFFNDETTVVTVQSNDNSIKVWDTRKIDEKIDKAKKQDKNRALIMEINHEFHLKQKLISLTEEIENLKEIKTKSAISRIWQLNAEFKANILPEIELLKSQTNNIKGYSSLFIDRNESMILTNLIDNKIQLYNIHKLHSHAPQVYSGLKSTYYVKSALSPCNNFIISGSKDDSIYIWDAKSTHQTPLVTLNGWHKGEVNAVDWSLGSDMFIASVADDETLYLWDYI